MKKAERALTRREVEEMVERAESLRDKALIAFLYLTGARISEALEVRAEDFRREGDWILVSVITLKKRRGERPRRLIPLPVGDPLTKTVMAWVEKVGEGRLWPFSRRWALEIIKRANPQAFCHLLRHTRLTHLVVEHDFGPYELVKWTGWTDPRPGETYIKLRWRDLTRKLSATA